MLDRFTYTAGGQTLTADLTVVDAPTSTRPTGAGYVAIESLNVGTDLRAAAVHSAAAGKVLTLPAGVFELVDYAQGGAAPWRFGLYVVPGQITGIVGSGPATVIRMKANSSTMTAQTALQTYSAGTQYLCSTVQFYGVNNVEFGNLTVRGTDQPHMHHGIRINGDNALIHDVKMEGAAWGSYNSPPGETYSFMVSGKTPVARDIEIDGSRDGKLVGSSALGILGGNDSRVENLYVHDLLSGFAIVYWQTVNGTTKNVRSIRCGSGASGMNGNAINHEMSSGKFTHEGLVVDLDAYYGPTDGRTRRTNGKFGHVTLWNTSNANAYDITIVEPKFDSWGGVKGGFAITVDSVQSRPKVVVNGVSLAPVTRPKWWEDKPTPFDPARQYWVTNVTGDASVWG